VKSVCETGCIRAQEGAQVLKVRVSKLHENDEKDPKSTERVYYDLQFEFAIAAFKSDKRISPFAISS
jgi:hypothetical protein